MTCTNSGVVVSIAVVAVWIAAWRGSRVGRERAGAGAGARSGSAVGAGAGTDADVGAGASAGAGAGAGTNTCHCWGNLYALCLRIVWIRVGRARLTFHVQLWGARFADLLVAFTYAVTFASRFVVRIGPKSSLALFACTHGSDIPVSRPTICGKGGRSCCSGGGRHGSAGTASASTHTVSKFTPVALFVAGSTTKVLRTLCVGRAIAPWVNRALYCTAWIRVGLFWKGWGGMMYCLV